MIPNCVAEEQRLAEERREYVLHKEPRLAPTRESFDVTQMIERAEQEARFSINHKDV